MLYSDVRNWQNKMLCEVIKDIPVLNNSCAGTKTLMFIFNSEMQTLNDRIHVHHI